MALFPLQGGMHGPLGQVDLVDTEMANILGGEVMTFTSVAILNTATEKSAADAQDGYLYDGALPLANRPAATRATTAANLPVYLADDGTTGYGTLFGQVIGTPTGLLTTGTNLGPHTAAASGKVTLWDKPGRYAVTLDAVVSDFVSSLSAAGLAPGAGVGITNAGQLTHAAGTGAVASSGVATFYEFASEPSLVTTPARLTGADAVYDRIVIDFHAGYGLRTL